MLMDDPITGLDVFAKHTIYKALNLLWSLDKSAVLLVTTSLRDAVVMSNRMSVLVDGRLRCVDALDELRAGFVIPIKLKPDAYGNPAAWTAVDGSVPAALPAATFSGQLPRFVDYGVYRMQPWSPMAAIQWPNGGPMADLKSHLQEFTEAVLLSEGMLQHVLLKITKYQDAPIKATMVPS